jgi:glycosyltransferase involved in cell wall biosynthesis
MKKRMKLIYVMQEFSPDVGGWAMHLFSELSKFIDVAVLAQPYKHSIKEAKEIEIINSHFKIIRYNGYELRGIIYPTDLKSLLDLEKETGNCVVQMDEFFKFYTIQAARWCRDNDIPYIISSRMRPRPGILRDAGMWVFKDMAEEAVARVFKIIATQGEVSKDEFLKWYALKTDSDFEIIPSGIDIDKFKGSEFIKKKTKKKIILNVARVYPIKRIDLLLQIFSKMLTFNDNIELWIIGKEDDNELLRLTKVMKKLGLKHGEEVKFFGGVPNKELYKYYSQAEVFVNTSETEGICFSFLEAMAFKLPIVAWDVGGNSGVIENEKTGFIVPFKDIENFSTKLSKLLGDKNLRKKMGNAAYIKLQKEFNIETNVQKLLKVYKEALIYYK